MITRKCGCKITEEGHFYSECKYHETHCHYGTFNKCRRKLKKDEFRYCKEHEEIMVKEGKLGIDAYGGSDF